MSAGTLNHFAIGPDSAGKFIVAYSAPGAFGFTAVCDGCTESDAKVEAARLNRMQVAAERAIRQERMNCGLVGVYPRLKGGN